MISKRGNNFNDTSMRMHLFISSNSIKSSTRWWMRGTSTKKLATSIIKLLKDMAAVSLNYKFCPPIVLNTLTLIFCILQHNCGKYQSFSPGDGTTIWHMIKYHYFIGVIIFPVLERKPCKGVLRKACCVSSAWREKMLNYGISCLPGCPRANKIFINLINGNKCPLPIYLSWKVALQLHLTHCPRVSPWGDLKTSPGCWVSLWGVKIISSESRVSNTGVIVFLLPNPACLLQWTRNVYSRSALMMPRYTVNKALCWQQPIKTRLLWSTESNYVDKLCWIC